MPFFYPPRPKSRILPSQLPAEEKRGIWLAQRKFKGDRCCISYFGGKVEFYNRHARKHAGTVELKKAISSLGLKKDTYLDGEFIKDKLVLFDILYFDKYLLGSSQISRLNLLTDLCGGPTQLCDTKIALEITPHLWLAEHWCSDLPTHFSEKIDHPLIEGLVLRKVDAVLDNWGATAYDVDWQLRVRKGEKNYRY